MDFRRSMAPSTTPKTTLPRFLAPVAMAMAAVVGCGGEAPPPVAPVTSVAARGAATPTPPPDVTPVPEPANLVLVGRLARPAASVRTLTSWLGAAASKTSLDSVSEELTKAFTGGAVGSLVDLEQPIDLAASARLGKQSAKGSFAISAALKNVEDAKRTLSTGAFRLTPAAGGVLTIETVAKGKGGGGGGGAGGTNSGTADDAEDKDEDDDDADDEGRPKRACALVPAFGPATTRLVCGTGDEALSVLAPYLTRTVTRTAPGKDLHLELRLGPVHGYVEENRRMLPLIASSLVARVAKGTALQELVVAVVNEIADYTLDLDTMAFDAQLAGEGAELAVTTHYRGATSLVARLSTSRADRVDVPPPAFLRLPVDAQTATYSRGAEDRDLEHPRQLLSAAVMELLVTEGVTAADARALGDAVGGFVMVPPFVYASGVDGAALDAALKGVADAGAENTPARKAASRRLFAEAFGWHVAGAEDGGKLQASARALAAAYGKASVQKRVRAKGAPTPTVRMLAIGAKEGLPQGSSDLEILVPAHTPEAEDGAAGKAAAKKGAKAPPAKPIAFHVLFVPEGSRTWVAVGNDVPRLVARAKGVLAGAPEAGTLAARKGIEAVRDSRANAGGFFTAEGALATLLALRVADPLSKRSVEEAQRALAVARTHRDGVVRLETVVQPASGGAPGGTVVSTVHVPRAVVSGSAALLDQVGPATN